QGDVSYKDVLKVHPFKNRITYIDWKASDLINYLNIVAKFPPDSGAYLQFHHITFDIKNDKVTNVRIAGESLTDGKTYRMS
ncbi:5'-nucleotidase C-terminal domain-containing protein, partial [Pseudoalteromonas ruthenica]